MGWRTDVKVALRQLLRSPGYSLVVVLTLAVGVGVNAALFSVVDGVLLEPLGYDRPEELVYLQADRRAEDLQDALVSGGDLEDLQGDVPGLTQVEGVGTIRQNLNGAGLPRQVQVGWVSPGFLSMLGAPVRLGRLFGPDDPPGQVVLSHRLWQNDLGGAPDVVGRTVQLDGWSATVVGVLEPGFRLTLPARGSGEAAIDLWKNPDDYWQNGDIWAERGPGFGILRLVGRREPDIPLPALQERLDAWIQALHENDPRYAALDWSVQARPLKDVLVRDVRPTLYLLLGAVTLVLLIACANVTNLLLVRARSRRREMAVRLALGSPRGRLGRALILETGILTALALVLGVALVAGFLHALPGLAPPALPRVDELALDPGVVAYTAGVALLVTLVVALAPLGLVLATDPARQLGNGRASSPGGGRLHGGLVVTQVALSVILLAGAALVTSSLVRLHAVEPGFDPQDLYTFGVSVPGSDYDWPEDADRFYRAVAAGVEALPGVEEAGVVWPMPFSGGWGGEVEVGAGEGVPLGLFPYKLATESWFGVARIPVVEGRLFREGDLRHTVLISRSVAERAFPEGGAVGRLVRADPWGRGLEDFEVIGVVGDVRDASLREASRGALYFDARGWSWVDWEVHVVARTTTDAGTLLPAIREVVAGLDPQVPVARPQPMSELVGREVAPTRFVLFLLGGFSVIAAVLSLVGLYGVVAYTVGMRRREFGIRLTLGAERSRIEGMVLWRGLRLALLGVLVGGGGAFLLADSLEAVVYEVSPRDPTVFLVVAGSLVVAALLASWVPARRAGSGDPTEVLRAE